MARDVREHEPQVAQPDLLTISVVAFFAVFVLLSLLAAIMYALTLVFPGTPEAAAVPVSAAAPDPDAAVLAAIAAAAAAAHPGARVTSIEEVR